ncbi:MAG: 4-hydroxy-tetrahydrodipicolinate synthase [Lachnospiraceae bacterium]|nr:4-hydroxy-tetrahydrodipicolinate synthase [Lachnospiraceae bacterium]
MANEPIFRGAATALITPLTENGVDYESFGRLIDWQISEGIDALVIAGTSGEGSTLTDEEHRAVLKFCIEKIAGRVPAIAGTGSNETDYAISLTKYASDLGYNGMLVVTPYYNKATQKGLVKMYNAIAEVSEAPIIAYNVPSRTGVNIEPSTYAELAKNPKISCIKEANGNISKIVETQSLVGDTMTMYSGNDDQIVPILSMGGQGVISVLSNLMPAQTSLMCKKFFEGDVAGSAKMQCELLPLINALFCEVNPIPVKAAMAAMGFCKNYVRLPLTVMEKDHEEKLLALMKEQNLI